MKKGFRVLLVDDNDDDRRLIGRFLKKACPNIAIDESQDAYRGMNMLAANGYDCALIDQNLPGGSGLDIIRQARNKNIKTPIIILVGHDDERLVNEVMHAGAADYLLKNKLLPEILCHSIENVIRLAKIESENDLIVHSLMEGERRMHALVDAAADAIISISEDGVVKSVNPATTSIFGYQQDELLGTNVSQILPGVVNEEQDAGIDRYLCNGRSADSDVRAYEIAGAHKNGQPLDLELCVSKLNIGDKNYYLGIIRDIQFRKKMTSAINVNQERLRYSQEFFKLGIWELDLDSRELYWSEQADKMLGFAAAHESKTLDDYVACVLPQDRRDVQQAINNCLQKELGYDIEHRVVWPDNSVHWVEACGGIIYDENGSPQRMVGVLMDITDRKEADATLSETLNKLRAMNSRMQDAQEQLLQSEKMASIGQLAAGVAHEINNPIGYISSNVGTLKQYINDLFDLIEAYESTIQSELDESKIQYIHKVKKDIDIDYLQKDLRDLIAESEEGVVRVKRIVQDLKDFSHVEEVEWEVANIHDGLDSTLNIVRNEIKYKADVIKEYGDIPPVECIISQLNQVFMNLLVNASHAIDDGSNGAITIRTYEDDGGVSIEIQDTGKGMSDDVVIKIFDPFFTTKPIGKGTGLGLSLSYAIINKHGGKISVTSKEGDGTLFKLWLPTKQDEKVQDESMRQHNQQNMAS